MIFAAKSAATWPALKGPPTCSVTQAKRLQSGPRLRRGSHRSFHRAQLENPVRVTVRDLLAIARRYRNDIEQRFARQVAAVRIVHAEHDAVGPEGHERGHKRWHREKSGRCDVDMINDGLA